MQKTMISDSVHDAAANVRENLLDMRDLVLSRIARGAPLNQTLVCIVDGIQTLHRHIVPAIFLVDEESRRLQLGAGPGLRPDYRRALGGVAAAWPYPRTADITDEQIRTCPSWLRFCELALHYRLHAHSPIPIRCAGGGVLGLLVAYSHQGEPRGEAHRQSIRQLATLASIAVQSARSNSMQQAQKSLQDNHDRMALAIEMSGTGIWDRNVETGRIHYSTGWKALFGYTDEQVSDWIEDSYQRVHPDDIPIVRDAMQAHFEQHTDSYAVEHRLLCADGSYKWASSRGKVVSRDAAGSALRMVGTTTDITALRTLSGQLQQSVNLITHLTNEVPGLVFEMNLSPAGEAWFTYVSEGVRAVYEIGPEQLAGDASLLEAIIHPDDVAGYRASLAACAAGLTPWHLEFRVQLAGQGLRWRQGNAMPRSLPDGGTQWHGFITDITERKQTEIELQEFATIDYLTKLPNRRCFIARMEKELARVQRIAGTRTAVLMCDIDHFKAINDNFGHAMGDRVLQNFADVLNRVLRELDIAGRIGGEEFAVVLSGAGLAEAHSFALRLQQHLADHPLREQGKTVAVTVSIGVAVLDVSDVSVDAALYRSDMALYRAKERGRNRIEIDGGYNLTNMRQL